MNDEQDKKEFEELANILSKKVKNVVWLFDNFVFGAYYWVTS